MSKTAKLAAAAAVSAAALLWNGDATPTTPSGFFTQAHAVIGRPATPVSYAGVARRTTRRAVVVGAASVPPPPPTTVVVEQPAVTCTEVTSPDGTVTKTCR